MLCDVYSGFPKTSQWSFPLSRHVSKNTKEEKNLFSPLELQLILAVAEEAIEKLAIFRARLPNVKPRFDLRPLRDRADEPYIPPYKPITRKAIDLWKWKLAWDLAQLQRILIIMRDELRQNGTNNTLQKFNYHQRNLDYESEQCEKILNKLKSNTLDAKHCSSQFSDKIEQLNSKLILIESEYTHTEHKVNIIKEYYKKYEKSRIGQNQIKIELSERELNKKIENLLNEKENEETTHAIIMKFLTESLKMLNEKVKYWDNEWKKDITLRDLEMKKLQADMEAQALQIQDLIIDYARREREIENYLIEREERERQEKIQQHIQTSAIKIQSWWRGCMVRWNLGPYSPDSFLKKKKKKIKRK